MTQEQRDKWVEALRSGKYEQGNKFLRLGDRYCCLGVLCDLDGAGWTPQLAYFAAKAGPVYSAGPSVHGSEIHTLSEEREERLEIEHGIVGQVIYMNDSGKTFAEIADWIEANVPVEP